MKPTIRRCTTIGLALLLGTVAFINHLKMLSAAPCDGVPLCETQVMTPVHYWSWQTSGWAYYCSGDHPYYWNNGQSTLGFGNNFTWDNSCFSVTENPFAEDASKMDATITNWCIHRGGEDITVTLGCSQQPQAGPSCPNNNTQVVFHDVKCPMQGSPQNHCAPGTFPVCYETWTEQCSDGPAYCTADLGAVWCVICGQ